MLVMIGDLVQQGITQNDFSVTGMLLVGSTVALLTVAVSYTNFRFPRLRPILEGEPVIVVAGRQADRPQPAPQPDHARGARRRSRGASSSPRSTTSSGPCSRPAARSASSRAAAPRLRCVPLYLTEERRRVAADAGGRARADRGVLPAAGARRDRQPAAHAPAGRGRAFARHVRGRPRARARRAEVLRRGCRRDAVRRRALRRRRRRAGRGDRGEPARAAAHGRGERRRGPPPRAPGRRDASA